MRRETAIPLAGLLVAAVTGCGGAVDRDRPASLDAAGTLKLTIRDGATGAPTPARVELLDDGGGPVVPEDALEIFTDCGSVPLHNWIPWTAPLQVLRNRHREIRNPYTGTTQFYTNGSNVVTLRPGRYTVAATKGLEYRRHRSKLTVSPGETRRVEVELTRWVDPPAEGWYGADDHLHIPRPGPRFDPPIATWMAAEGLHVANLLQMGLARDVHITPQRAFGESSVYRRGNTIVMSGQENPRTHVLGHSIVLGARRFIDDPPYYLLYDRVWEEAHRQGAINGYAHWALAGAEEGLAAWGHGGLLDFIEVLSLGIPRYERWYEALDLGLRIGPTAGTDHPCLPSLPGRDRFYARLDGPLDAGRWLDAVRRGRTFVTNGPVIDLTVSDTEIGDELTLEAPGEVRVAGGVRFDPERDAITWLELVRAGSVALRVEAPASAGEIRLDTPVRIEQSTWLALRAGGTKRGETEVDLRGYLETMLVLDRATNDGLLEDLPAGPIPRPSAAHTAAIHVTVRGTPSIAEQPRGQEVALAWLARLDELEARLADDRLANLAGFPGRGDGLDARTLHGNRAALLEAIRTARRHLEGDRSILR